MMVVIVQVVEILYEIMTESGEGEWVQVGTVLFLNTKGNTYSSLVHYAFSYYILFY